MRARTTVTSFHVAHRAWIPKFSYRTFCDCSREEFAQVEDALLGRKLSPVEHAANWRDRIAYATGCRRRIKQCGAWEPS